MKSEILSLLALGAKSDIELEACFAQYSTTEIIETIEELKTWGVIESHSRQVHEGNNVFRWDREYRLCNPAVVAA